MKIPNDLAFDQHPIEFLYESECLLEDEYPIYGLYCYIGKMSDDSLHFFTSNLANGTIRDFKRNGVKEVYRCDFVTRSKELGLKLI